MSTVHNNFELKRSRLAITLQSIVFGLITFLLFKTLSLLLFILFWLLLIFAFYLLLKRIKISSIQYLDKNEWTLTFEHTPQVEHVGITRLINHHIYIVIYIDCKKYDPLIIWCDQLSAHQWRSLLVLAKLF